MTAPQGMAEGGLASLPVPYSMYDEPVDAQSFRGGGIVAFADGGQFADIATLDATDRLGNAMNPAGPPPPPPPPNPALGYDAAEAIYNKAVTDVPHKYSDMRAKEYEKDNTPEALAEQKKYDLFSAIGQFGSALGASKSPNFMTAVTEAAGIALPGMAKTRADRQANQRVAIKELAADEATTRTEKIQRAGVILGIQKDAIKTDLDQKTYNLALKKAADDLDIDLKKIKATADQHAGALAEETRHNKADEVLKGGTNRIAAETNRLSRAELQNYHYAQIRNTVEDNVRQQIKDESTDPFGAPIKGYVPLTPAQFKARVDAALVAYNRSDGTSAGGSGDATGGKTVKRTGVLNGRKVIEYTDGTSTYAN
jgi:hypothetical protein